MSDFQLAVAWVEACNKLIRAHGNGPYDDLRWIGRPADDGFSFVCNSSKEKKEIDGVPYGFIHVYRNGLPLGVLTPFDGSMIGLLKPGQIEREFIEWCRSDAL